MYDIFLQNANKDSEQYKQLKERFPTLKTAATFSEAQKKCFTKFFWFVWDDLVVEDTFKFDYEPDSGSQEYVHVFLNDKEYDGIGLFPKNSNPTNKEFTYRFFVNKKEVPVVASTPAPFDYFEVDSFEEYEYALENSKTEMFWMSSKNITVNRELIDMFYLTHHNSYDRNENHAFIHDVNERRLYNGLFLCSKNKPLSKKEVDFRFIVNRKEWDIIGSTPCKYDIFYIDNYDQYLEAFEKSRTEMFWGVSHNLSFDLPDIYFTHDNEYDRKQNHAFIHRVDDKDLYNGVFLFSKHAPVSQREIEHRFIVNHKPWNVVASGPVTYDKFSVDSYEDYVAALNSSTTEMFWGIPKDVDVADDFKFNLYFEHSNTHDRSVNHAFLNNDTYDGIMLFSKQSTVSQREVDYRFYANKKEWNIVASTPKPFDVFNIDTYEQYLQALDNTTTELFWVSTNNIALDENFVNSFYISHHEQIDRKQNHAFIHRVKDKDLYNGLFLCSKNKPLSKREVEHRFIVNRKEWDIVASGPCKYEIFKTDTYEDYQNALQNSKTEMFYAIPPYVDIDEDFKFDDYFSFDEKFEREINHVYLNNRYHDGVVLCSKYAEFTKREFDYKFIAAKKEVNVLASHPKPYDIVFISYEETNADQNYQRLLDRFPNAKRVHGVKGIHQAHIEAAKLCNTDMFYIVDGDAVIMDDFYFDYQVARWDKETVHVWRSINPINDLVYGYGGAKLFPTELTINMDTTKPDMTTSISSKFKAMGTLSVITGFNTSPFETWKSAFRECAKLSARIIDRQKDTETLERLKTWCTVGKERKYGEYSILGAVAGKEYGEKYKDSPQDLRRINDFDWLKEKFNDAN